MKCRKCDADMAISFGGMQMTTLVAYISPPGHNHDDNCTTKEYVCPNGHKYVESIINQWSCCHGHGKTSCFCSNKVWEWTDPAIDDYHPEWVRESLPQETTKIDPSMSMSFAPYKPVSIYMSASLAYDTVGEIEVSMNDMMPDELKKFIEEGIADARYIRRLNRSSGSD